MTEIWRDLVPGSGAYVPFASHSPAVGVGGYTARNTGVMYVDLAGSAFTGDAVNYATYSFGAPATLAQSVTAKFFPTNTGSDHYLYVRYSPTGAYYFARFGLSGAVGIYYWSGSATTPITEVAASAINFVAGPQHPYYMTLAIDAGYGLTLTFLNENLGTIATITGTDSGSRISTPGMFAFAMKDSRLQELSATDLSAAGVAPTFAGTIPAKTGSVGSAFAFGSPAAASYFSNTPTSYGLSAGLPAGMNIDPATGVIGGTPSAAASWSGQITATNNAGSASSNTFMITIAGAISLTLPTKSAASGTSMLVGFTTNTSGGTARAVVTRSATVPTVAQVKAGQDATGTTAGVLVPASLSVTAAGAYVFPAVSGTTGLTYYGYIVQTDGTGTDSSVLSVGSMYPGTGRAVADVSAAGWVASAGGLLAAMLSEDAADDATFITSPTLTTTPAPAIFSLDKPYLAGTYPVSVRASVDTGTGKLRVKFLNDAGTVQGTTADQALTITPTTYTLNITTTGTATRLQIEVTT